MIRAIECAMCPKWQVGPVRIALTSKQVRRYRFGLRLRGFGAGLGLGWLCITWG